MSMMRQLTAEAKMDGHTRVHLCWGHKYALAAKKIRFICVLNARSLYPDVSYSEAMEKSNGNPCSTEKKKCLKSMFPKVLF